MKVLIVDPHEGELDAGELAFCDVGLGRLETQRAHLLPVGVGGRTHVDAGDLQNLRAYVALRQHARRPAAESAQRGRGAHAGRPLENAAPCQLQPEQPLVYVRLHCLSSRSCGSDAPRIGFAPRGPQGISQQADTSQPSGSLVSTCDRRGLRVCGHLCKCQQIPEESVGGVQPSMIGSIRSGGVKPRTRRGWRFLVKGGFVFANRTSRGDLVDGRAHCPRSSSAARGALGGRRGEPKSHPPWHQLRLSDQRRACCARPRDGSTVTVLVGLSLRGKHARPAEAERA